VRRAPRRPAVALLVVAVAAVAFFALPLLGLLQQARWSTLVDDLTSPGARDALRLSLVVSLGATALALGLGTPLAWVLARAAVPARSLLRSLVLLPMVVPPVVGGTALLAALGPESPVGGWLDDAFGVVLPGTTTAAVLAAAFVAMPFYVITVEGALRGVDRRLEQVAASLGAGRATVLRRVTLPIVGPSLVSGAVLAWARALGEFGATVTFAGNVEGQTRTLPLAVSLRLQEDQGSGIALSLVLVAVSVVVLAALRDRWLRTP